MCVMCVELVIYVHTCMYEARLFCFPSPPFHRMPERGSLGLRFFSTSRSQSQRRQMKNSLIGTGKAIQQEIDELLRPRTEGEEEREEAVVQERMVFLQNCLRSAYISDYML